MSDVTTALRSALEDEPPLGFGPPQVLARGRRTRRCRRAVTLAGTAASGAAVVAGAALTAVGAAPAPGARQVPGRAPALTLTALGRIAAARQNAAPARAGHASSSSTRAGAGQGTVGGISAAALPGLIEHETVLQLTEVRVIALPVPTVPPAAELNLTAAIAVPGRPFLNVQLIPAHSMTTRRPTCAELSDVTSGNGDGYYGPCHISTLSHGSILVVRSGQTASGGFIMAQAVLIRPDGSGVFAEDTNESWTVPRPPGRPGKAAAEAAKKRAGPLRPSVSLAQAAIGAPALARLVQALAAQPAS